MYESETWNTAHYKCNSFRGVIPKISSRIYSFWIRREIISDM